MTRCLVPLCPGEGIGWGYCADHRDARTCDCGATYRHPLGGFQRAKLAHEASAWHRAYAERQWALANDVAR